MRFHRIIEYKSRERWNWLHVGIAESYIQGDDDVIYLHRIGNEFMTPKAARVLGDALHEAADDYEAKRA
jgi:hypothetical protein